MTIKRALISVSDKTGLDFLVKELTKLGIEIISTGGTRKFIEDLGLEVSDIADFTGFPEILDGRVKTLHPKVHGALLAKRNLKEHTEQVEKHGIKYIDMVVVNLYPFKKMLKKLDSTHEEMIENIDIGGPSMLRSAAKNYESVVVICDPNDYKLVIDELKISGDISLETRASLAAKVFVETSSYDNIIQNYLNKKGSKNANLKSLPLPNQINKKLIKNFDLRYGENPHQKAGYYLDDDDISGITWRQIGGKELSYNNILDIDACWKIVNSIKTTGAVIVKHNNPCGAGTDVNLKNAYLKALSTDPVSAFGGIVAVNKKLDVDTANEIIKIFTECVVAPEFDLDAINILLTKPNLRIIQINGFSGKSLEYKRVFCGFLVQEQDFEELNERKIVTDILPTDSEIKDLDFAWNICKYVKSNAILIAKNGKVLGIGAGQMSRVDSVEIAIMKAKKSGLEAELDGSVLASDAFFPFQDSIEIIAKYGIKSVIQPGGSIKDKDVIECCNQNKISMIFTGQRHFRH